MKLYATTTSERATKGQGGNKFINISLAGELKNTAGMPTRRELVKVYAEMTESNEILLQIYDTYDNDKVILEKFIPLTLKGTEEKAKRQKAESISGGCTCDEGDCHCQDCDPRY